MNELSPPARRPRGAGRDPASAWSARLRARLRRPPKKTTVAVALVLVFHVALYFQFTLPGRRLPSFILKLVALADAAFVASMAQFILDDWGVRRWRLRLPGGRSVAAGTLAGAAAFALVAAIWFSPWAPIQSASPGATGDVIERAAPGGEQAPP